MNVCVRVCGCACSVEEKLYLGLSSQSVLVRLMCCVCDVAFACRGFAACVSQESGST